MKIGLVMFPSDRAISPDGLAQAAEERGFEMLLFPEHTHIPVSRLSPYPAGGDLPDYYARTLDPFVALTAAAAATSRLRIGTGVCLVAQRDPLILAKEVASLDRLSGGRFVFGVGYGWNREEMADHGVRFAERRLLLREKVLAMQRLWTEEKASFEGEYVSFPPTWLWPKPLQDPWPPIIVGGAAGPITFAHVAELASGWMPIAGRGRPLEDAIPMLHRILAERGRNPADIEVTIFGVRPGAEIERYEDLGVHRVLLMVPPEGRDSVLQALDRYAHLVR